MSGGRAIEPFEPILIEERSKGGLAKRRLPDDPEQRGRCLVSRTLQWQQNGGALGRVTIECVGARAEPELDQPSPLGRGQYEMGDLVQNYIRLGRAVQRRPVPVEAARGPLRVARHAAGTGEGERRKAMPLCLGSGRAVG
jgi:hypothetical protein